MATTSVRHTSPAAEQAPTVGLLDQIVSEAASRYMPTLTVKQFTERERMLREIKLMLVEGNDYGVIPGTQKPTLLKPGAEKLCAFFGYAPHYQITECIEDWLGERYGEPLFYYRISCVLAKDGKPVGEGIGSCSSWESKYRYRYVNRKCPQCGAEAIIKGKYGGGWLCFAKKGGCGAKFGDGDPAIEGQGTGKVANPDIADQVNTIQKMAQKRAYIAATLSATGASQYFTQDVDDMPHFNGDEEGHERSEPQGSLDGWRRCDRIKEEEMAGTKDAAHPAQAQAAEPRQIPQEVIALWGRMTSIQSVCDVMAELKAAISDLTGSERPYYEILAKHGVEKANQFKSTRPARLCARALWEYIEGCKRTLSESPAADEAATVPPDYEMRPITDERETWVPENIGGRR